MPLRCAFIPASSIIRIKVVELDNKGHGVPCLYTRKTILTPILHKSIEIGRYFSSWLLNNPVKRDKLVINGEQKCFSCGGDRLSTPVDGSVHIFLRRLIPAG
jgi:hypothetical protein